MKRESRTPEGFCAHENYQEMVEVNIYSNVSGQRPGSSFPPAHLPPVKNTSPDGPLFYTRLSVYRFG